MNPLESLFNPKSISLIGAAHTEAKFGGIILKNLLRFKGKVYPVNPNYTYLMGLKAYPSVEKLPESVDLSIIIRPAPQVPEILKAHKDKAKCVIIISSGFAEIGEKNRQDEILHIARELNIRILGPNCIGIYNPYQRLDTLFLSYERLKRPKKGNIAVVSQSGAILSCLFGAIRKTNIGLSRAIHYGNAVDIDESDIYEYLANNDETRVVISYIESVKEGRKFIDRARLLSEKKPLLILKSGKSSRGQVAAYSHTGRLAGRYEVFHSILRQFNIKEVEDFDELMDAAKAISYQKPSPGQRVLILTNGGGSGVLAADECMRQKLEVAPLPEKSLKILKPLFPSFCVLNNPLDLTAHARDEDYLTALHELKEDYDGFIVISLTGVTGITERFIDLLKDFKTNTPKPIVSHIAYDSISRKLTLLLEKIGIPVYPSPERAVRGLKALLNPSPC